MLVQTHNDCLVSKSFVITGHNGFVGSWLSVALTAVGAHVHGWSHLQESALSPWDFLSIPMPNVSPVDINDAEAVCSALRSANPDLIVHLAGQTNVGTCMKVPREAFETNCLGTMHILDAIRALGLRCKVVLASSDAVFGNVDADVFPKQGIDETHSVTFGEPYGTSKAVAELVASCYQETYFRDRLTVAIVRFANAFGYGDPNEKRVIPQFVLGALTKGEVHLKYRLNGRQFIYVTDLIAGILAVCRWLLMADSVELAPVVAGGELAQKPAIFHLAMTDYPHTEEPFVRMKHLAELVCASTGARVNQIGSIDYSPIENKVQALNCARTKELLGWRPVISLSDGIILLTGWYREMLTSTPHRCTSLYRLVGDAVTDIVKCSTTGGQRIFDYDKR